LLQGHRLSFIPGWDCHGLPIEIKALELWKKSGDKKELTAMEIRELGQSILIDKQ
jgi:isoleucyl-tRNA synthetase